MLQIQVNEQDHVEACKEILPDNSIGQIGELLKEKGFDMKEKFIRKATLKKDNYSYTPIVRKGTVVTVLSDISDINVRVLLENGETVRMKKSNLDFLDGHESRTKNEHGQLVDLWSPTKKKGIIAEAFTKSIIENIKKIEQPKVTEEEFAKKVEIHKSMTDQGEERVQGTVKAFLTEKGFGFISLDGASLNDKQIFIHISHVNGADALYEGDRVDFYIKTTPKGPEAFDLDVLGMKDLSYINNSHMPQPLLYVPDDFDVQDEINGVVTKVHLSSPMNVTDEVDPLLAEANEISERKTALILAQKLLDIDEKIFLMKLERADIIRRK